MSFHGCAVAALCVCRAIERPNLVLGARRRDLLEGGLEFVAGADKKAKQSRTGGLTTCGQLANVGRDSRHQRFAPTTAMRAMFRLCFCGKRISSRRAAKSKPIHLRKMGRIPKGPAEGFSDPIPGENSLRWISLAPFPLIRKELRNGPKQSRARLLVRGKANPCRRGPL